MRYALITGVSSGIGKATAERFLQEGFYVFGSVRKLEHANHLKESNPDRFHPLVFDITHFDQVDLAIEEIRMIVGEGGLDVLVNNAGIAKYGPIQHVPIDDLRQQFEINVFSNVNLTQKTLPLLGAYKDAVKRGKVFVISSTAGIMTRPMLGPYSSSKHAIEAIYDALRRELMIYGMDVIIIEPGPIKTDIWGKAKIGGNPYKNTDYSKIFAQLDDAVDQIEKIGLDVSRVSNVIWKAYISKKPKARYIITPKKMQFLMAMYVLPAKKLDKIFFKEFKNLIN